MNDSPAKIAVIQSRLPYVDRRALSQAWFSALHLAENAPGSHRGIPANGVAPFESPLARGGASSPREFASVRAAGSRVMPAPSSARREAPLAPYARPARAAVRTRRVTNATPALTLRQRVAPLRASFAFGASGERVHVLLRREGAVLHVVAVCRPAVADAVARALAAASAELRSGGDAVRAGVRAFDAVAVRA